MSSQSRRYRLELTLTEMHTLRQYLDRQAFQAMNEYLQRIYRGLNALIADADRNKRGRDKKEERHRVLGEALAKFNDKELARLAKKCGIEKKYANADFVYSILEVLFDALVTPDDQIRANRCAEDDSSILREAAAYIRDAVYYLGSNLSHLPFQSDHAFRGNILADRCEEIAKKRMREARRYFGEEE